MANILTKLVYIGLKANLPSNRDANSFYLCTDTKELYFGETLYTEAVRFYTSDSQPAIKAQGVLYINSVTGDGYAWDGSAWKSVITGSAGIDAKIEAAIDELDLENTYEQKGAKDAAIADAKKAGTGAQSYAEGVAADLSELQNIVDGLGNVYDAKGTAEGVKDELTTEIEKKQDKLVFETAYDSSINKAATMADVKAATADLSGAMHWKGEVEKKPGAEMGASYKSGDVVSYQGVEYAWDGTTWVELGDESKYASKVADWDTAAAQTHTHANKDLLDAYDQTNTDIKDAVTKKHEHANKAALDEFTTGDKAKLDATSTAAAKAAADIKSIKDGEDIDSFADVEAAIQDLDVTALAARVTAIENALTVGTFTAG